MAPRTADIIWLRQEADLCFPFSGKCARWDGWAEGRRCQNPSMRCTESLASQSRNVPCRPVSGEHDRGNTSYQVEKRAFSRSTTTANRFSFRLTSWRSRVALSEFRVVPRQAPHTSFSKLNRPLSSRNSRGSTGTRSSASSPAGSRCHLFRLMFAPIRIISAWTSCPASIPLHQIAPPSVLETIDPPFHRVLDIDRRTGHGKLAHAIDHSQGASSAKTFLHVWGTPSPCTNTRSGRRLGHGHQKIRQLPRLPFLRRRVLIAKRPQSRFAVERDSITTRRRPSTSLFRHAVKPPFPGHSMQPSLRIPLRYLRGCYPKYQCNW